MQLAEVFWIVPYDTRAALINAKIWNDREEEIKKLQNQGISRQTIKVDIQIISVALAADCEVLYINDQRMERLAKNVIKTELFEKITFLEQKNLLLGA